MLLVSYEKRAGKLVLIPQQTPINEKLINEFSLALLRRIKQDKRIPSHSIQEMDTYKQIAPCNIS